MSDICAKNLGHGHAFNRPFGSTYKCQWCGALQSDIEEKAEYKSLLRENKALKEQNALLTVQVPDGWKVVPVDLPQNHPMRSKMIEYAERIAAGQSILYADMWADIVANAPALPQQVKSELGHVGVFTREINSGFGAFKYEVYQGEPLEPGTKLYTHGDETRKKAARYDWLKSHARTIEWFEADESREREYLRPTLDDDIDAAISAQENKS